MYGCNDEAFQFLWDQCGVWLIRQDLFLLTLIYIDTSLFIDIYEWNWKYEDAKNKNKKCYLAKILLILRADFIHPHLILSYLIRKATQALSFYSLLSCGFVNEPNFSLLWETESSSKPLCKMWNKSAQMLIFRLWYNIWLHDTRQWVFIITQLQADLWPHYRLHVNAFQQMFPIKISENQFVSNSFLSLERAKKLQKYSKEWSGNTWRGREK